MDELLQMFSPWDISDVTKIRLGGNADGGYVIPKELVLKCESFLSFGIGGSYSFERDLVKLTNKPIYMYDHTVSINPNDPNLIFEKKGVAKTPSDLMVSIPEIIKPNTFIKMDVEGAEWDVLDDMSDINILVIEMHGFLEMVGRNHFAKRKLVLNKLHDKFVTFHTHLNNWSPGGDYGKVSFGHVAEITFVDRNWLNNMNHTYTKSITPLPIPNLDYPNCPWVADLPIKFS